MVEFNKASMPFWAFAYLLAKEAISALAMFLGATPVLAWLLPSAYSFTGPVLNITWLLSGAAAVYLIWLWRSTHRPLFPARGNPLYDKIAVIFLLVTGINTGLAAIISNPILSIIPYFYPLLVVAGLAKLVVTIYLLMRWKASNYKLF